MCHNDCNCGNTVSALFQREKNSCLSNAYGNKLVFKTYHMVSTKRILNTKKRWLYLSLFLLLSVSLYFQRHLRVRSKRMIIEGAVNTEMYYICRSPLRIVRSLIPDILLQPYQLINFFLKTFNSRNGIQAKCKFKPSVSPESVLYVQHCCTRFKKRVCFQ